MNLSTIKNFKFLLVFLLLSLSICFSFNASAQKATIRGTVIDKETGEPILFTYVSLKATKYGVQTDENGFYSIASIPAGDYILYCTYLGYDTAQIRITLKNDEIVSQKIFLTRARISLGNVTITAKTVDNSKVTTANISVTKITSKDINRLPSVGGESDLAQYLQIIPGVIFTGDQGGELFIRGGTPIQTKMLLDGMTLYNPFHSIGLFSVYETDIIKNVNVLAGGFGAEYGGRLSAVVDVQTRDGNKKYFTGKIAVNPFQSKIILEGPIKKLTEDSKSSISYIFTGKTSYLDKTSKIFYPYINENSGGLPYYYTDLYGKISLNGANGSKLSFFGFNYTDNVNYADTLKFGWKTYGFGTNFVIVPGNSNTLISGSLTYSNYNINLAQANQPPRTSSINGFDLITTVTYFLPQGELKYGINIGGYATNLDYYNSITQSALTENQNTTELSGYLTFKKATKRWVIEPGFRLQYYASLPALSPEPRLAVKYIVNKFIRLKAATGIYSQSFISTKSDKDVVDLFTAFLTAPDGQLSNLMGQPVNNNLQKATHLIAGIEADITPNLNINIEPYYKYYGQLINLNRNKILPTDPDFQVETGNAYGIDFLAKYEYKNFYLWLGYSFSYVTLKENIDNQIQTYPPYYDRRHNVNVVVSYDWGKNKAWEASARWNLGSGFPFTKIQGFYEYLPFDGGLYTNYQTSNGQLGTIYDNQLNDGRLPYYHRLDLSLRRSILFSERSKLEIVGSVINVYDRQNIFYYDPIRMIRVNQLPILPALGISLTF